MKTTVKLALLAVILSASACVTPSKVTYIKDMEFNVDYPAKPAPELRVQKGDQLSIQVFSSDPALAVPFNTGALTTEGVGVTRAATYIVDSFGEIDFPVLGRIPLEGMTLKEVQQNIATRIINLGYIKEPVVSVNLENFTVTIVKYGTTNRINVAGRSSPRTKARKSRKYKSSGQRTASVALMPWTSRPSRCSIPLFSTCSKMTSFT